MSIYLHDLNLPKTNNLEDMYYEGWQNFYDMINSPVIQEGTEEYKEYINYLTEGIDEEGIGGKLRPVFVVLLYSDTPFDRFVEKFVKGQSYWHAAIAFGPALSRCYSFNFGLNKEAGTNKFKGGLSFESLKMYQEELEGKEATMEVNCVLLPKDKYAKVKESLEYYLMKKEKTKYSFMNLLYSFLGKSTDDKNFKRTDLVCSTFVDGLLKSAGVDLNKIHNNLVKPDDLKAKPSNTKQFKLFQGALAKYKPKVVEKKVSELADDTSNSWFSKKK